MVLVVASSLPIYPLVPFEYGTAEMYNLSKNFNFFKTQSSHSVTCLTLALRYLFTGC